MRPRGLLLPAFLSRMVGTRFPGLKVRRAALKNIPGELLQLMQVFNGIYLGITVCDSSTCCPRGAELTRMMRRFYLQISSRVKYQVKMSYRYHE